MSVPSCSLLIYINTNTLIGKLNQLECCSLNWYYFHSLYWWKSWVWAFIWLFQGLVLAKPLLHHSLSQWQFFATTKALYGGSQSGKRALFGESQSGKSWQAFGKPKNHFSSFSEFFFFVMWNQASNVFIEKKKLCKQWYKIGQMIFALTSADICRYFRGGSMGEKCDIPHPVTGGPYWTSSLFFKQNFLSWTKLPFTAVWTRIEMSRDFFVKASLTFFWPNNSSN